jgi:hypothetical protein
VSPIVIAVSAQGQFIALLELIETPLREFRAARSFAGQGQKHRLNQEIQPMLLI